MAARTLAICSGGLDSVTLAHRLAAVSATMKTELQASGQFARVANGQVALDGPVVLELLLEPGDLRKCIEAVVGPL